MNENLLQETQALLKQMAVLVQMFESRSVQATRRIEAGVNALNQSVEQIADSGGQLARDALTTLGAQGAEILTQGTAQAVGAFQRQMQQSASQARELEQVLAQHRRGVVGLTRVALIVLAVGALLAAGGSIYVAYDRARVVENAQFGQDTLKATNSGAINRCGGKLCARVGKAPARYSQNPEYVLIGE